MTTSFPCLLHCSHLQEKKHFTSLNNAAKTILCILDNLSVKITESFLVSQLSFNCVASFSSSYKFSFPFADQVKKEHHSKSTKPSTVQIVVKRSRESGLIPVCNKQKQKPLLNVHEHQKSVSSKGKPQVVIVSQHIWSISTGNIETRTRILQNLLSIIWGMGNYLTYFKHGFSLTR